MADCIFQIIGPTDLREGEAATYRIDPPVVHPCTTEIRIDGQKVHDHVGRDIGDFHITQAAAGSMSVTALTDNPQGRLTVTMTCLGEQPCGPTTRAVRLGSFVQQPNVPEEIIKTVALPISLTLFAAGLISWGIGLLPFTGDLAERSRDYLKKVHACFPEWFKDLVR